MIIVWYRIWQTHVLCPLAHRMRGTGEGSWSGVAAGSLTLAHIQKPEALVHGKLVLEDGSEYVGVAFGSEQSVAGEVVFNTGMVGYPETLSDPSYRGQILVLTYPLIGNYGVPALKNGGALARNYESLGLAISGLIVCEYSTEYSHWDAAQGLSQMLQDQQVPALTGIDTRAVTKKLRREGAMLGKVVFADEAIEFDDPNLRNLPREVCVSEPKLHGAGKKRVVLLDCGAKHGIIRDLLKQEVSVLRVPFDHDFWDEQFDGILISNGPGDPKMCEAAVGNIRRALDEGVPTFGICLGHQLLALAAGADTHKMKYGHRSQNQPCVQVGTRRCFITSQNHGYVVDEDSLAEGWQPWFFNANDGTNEGIRHSTKPFRSVQFHPEAAPGPCDTGFLFDEFMELIGK